MEEEEIDFFSVLELSKDSTLEDIRKAYKALVIRWHPDKNPPSCKKEAEAKFKAITQAYEVFIILLLLIIIFIFTSLLK